jgi:hypothetical protein
MSPTAQRQRWVLGVPVLAVALGLIILATVRLLEHRPTPLGFGMLFLHTLVLLMVFNVVDLLVIDWLFFVRIRPRFVVLPGTEGLAGYGDYRFHWRAFLKGSAGIVVVSGMVAGIVTAFS